jgi:hypothetical protein
MKLESSYIRTEQLGALPEDYKWKNGICYNIKTGAPYTGNQRDSNCYSLYGPYKEPTGFAAAASFLKQQAEGLIAGRQGFQQGVPSTTASNLLVPAVLVVGGIGLLLILKKKK